MPSTINYRADAPLVAQVSSFTITGYDATTTYRLTINNKVISTVGTGGTAATTAAALQVLLAACTYPEFQEVTFSVNSATITMTANTAGRPFTAASSVSGGTGTIGAVSTSVANSGPSDMSVAANYSGGALPTTGDTLIFENLQNVSVLYGLNALTGVVLAAVYFRNCSSDFGLPQFNGQYWEYRPLYLKLSATLVVFDCSNCQLARIDSEAEQTLFIVRATGTSKENSLEALLWKGSHASNVVNIDRGSVGIAMLSNETAVIATMNQGYIDNAGSDARVRVSSGVTLGVVNRTGGTLELNCAATGILTQREGAGTLTLRGTGAYLALRSHAGDIVYESSGTITNMTLGEGITFDARQNENAFEITNVVQGFKGCKFLDPMKKATGPAAAAWVGLKANGCKPHEVTIDRGPDCTILAA